MAVRTKTLAPPVPDAAMDEPEAELHFGRPAELIAERAPRPDAIDLTGKPKVWFAVGPGRSGKTTLLRWAAEALSAKDGQALFAAADPQNRSLKGFIEGVEEPPNNDAAATTRWLERQLRSLMQHKVSALIDLGGGDTSLGRLVAQMPDLAQLLEDGGLTPVAFYTLGPRIDDLSAMAALAGQGFRPRATAIVLNEGLADPTSTREENFARILRHSVFRAAVDAGAVTLWMPRLEPAVAQTVESKRLHFSQAADRQSSPLGEFDSYYVRRWLERMQEEMAPIMSWLPA